MGHSKDGGQIEIPGPRLARRSRSQGMKAFCEATVLMTTFIFQAANLFKRNCKPKGLPTDAAGLKEIVAFYEKNFKQMNSPIKKPQLDEEKNVVKSPSVPGKMTNGKA